MALMVSLWRGGRGGLIREMGDDFRGGGGGPHVGDLAVGHYEEHRVAAASVTVA